MPRAAKRENLSGPSCQRAALKWVTKTRKAGVIFFFSPLEAEPQGEKPPPGQGPPPSQTPEVAERGGAFKVGPEAGAGLLSLSQAEKEPGAASYLFSHFPHSVLEPDRPRRLPLAGLAAKSFRLFIFVGVSRDTFATCKALISMPNGFTNHFPASGEFFKYLE